MKDTRKRGRQKKPKNFNKRERERERASGSLSAFFTRFFSSSLVILALVSSKKRAKREGNYP